MLKKIAEREKKGGPTPAHCRPFGLSVFSEPAAGVRFALIAAPEKGGSDYAPSGGVSESRRTLNAMALRTDQASKGLQPVNVVEVSVARLVSLLCLMLGVSLIKPIGHQNLYRPTVQANNKGGPADRPPDTKKAASTPAGVATPFSRASSIPVADFRQWGRGEVKVTLGTAE